MTHLYLLRVLLGISKMFDLTGDRLFGAIVRAGIESDIFQNAACGLPVTIDQASIPGAHIQFLCDPPVIARYVSVDDDKTFQTDEYASSLTLCEVKIEEYSMDECPQHGRMPSNNKLQFRAFCFMWEVYFLHGIHSGFSAISLKIFCDRLLKIICQMLVLMFTSTFFT